MKIKIYNWLKNGLIIIFTLCLVIFLNWHTLPVFSQLTQNIKPLPDVPGLTQDSTPTESSLLRYQRFEQLLEKNGSQSRYGKINPSEIVKILRDRTNPLTKKASSPSVFDDNASIGGNGSLRQVVFDPERLLFWIAAGKVPIPKNQFTCFSLGDMLSLPNAKSCPAKAIY